MRLTKTIGMAGALVLSAVIGGTLIGSAFATTDESTDGDTATTTAAGGEYCQTFLDALAAELGTDRDGLTAAGKAAALAAVDAAVAAGDLTEERAAEVRERIEAADGDGCGWLGSGFGRGFAHGFARGEARGFLGGDVFEAAADALGMESADLIGELRDAGSLQALAEAQGVSYEDVKASVIAAIQADLDAAVAEGLSQERADAVMERLTTWLDNGGQLGELRPGRGGFGPGPWGSGGHTDDADEADPEGSDEDGSGA